VADESSASADGISNLRSSNYIERDDGPVSLEDAPGDSMSWMRGETWVAHAADQGMLFKPGCEHHGCLLGPLQPKRESSGAASGQKHLERSWRGPA
jgi:hypothetical protein